MGGAQGAQQLPLPAAPARGQRRRPTASSSSTTMAPTTQAEITRLAKWAGASPTGDLAELDWTPSDTRVASGERGQRRVPRRRPLSARRAVLRRAGPPRAGAADVVVVNTHLYGLDVASGGAILPEHDVVVFDEAHGLEDIMSDTVGVRSLRGGSSRWRRGRAPDPRRPELIASIDGARRSARRGARTARRQTPADAAARRRSDEFLVEARTGSVGSARRCRRSTPRSRTPSSASCGPRR